MRIAASTLVLSLALALAGCATPPRQPETSTATVEPAAPAAPTTATSEPPAAPAEPPEPALPALVPPAPISPVASTPFSPAAAAALEELPLAADDLWDRIRGRFEFPEIEGPDVTKWEQWYASRPDYVARMIDRSRRYLYYVVVEVEQRRMPAEIALLPMIESAYNPNAMSTSRASGIWQFIPSTGTLYGLKQNFWFDSRRDVIAATAGALAYLDKLHAQFDDWQLALSAYNWGEGNVARAIERNRKAGLGADYTTLPMPDETRNYLPKLQAVKNIIRDPQKYGIELGDIPDAPYFAAVRTSKEMDLKRAAELAEMSVDEFKYLNPHHNRPVIAGADEYTLLLPIDKAELFAAKLDLIDQPLVSWQAYRMRPGETLQQIASRFGMSVETLRAVNGIGAKSTVPPGHAVLVPAQSSRESADSLTHAVFTTVPQGRTFYYQVVRGDTMSTIASRYDVSTADIRHWNSLVQNAVRPGQRLRITSDSSPRALSAKRAGGKPIRAASASSPGGAKVKATEPVRVRASVKRGGGRRSSRAAAPLMRQTGIPSTPRRERRGKAVPTPR